MPGGGAEQDDLLLAEESAQQALDLCASDCRRVAAEPSDLQSGTYACIKLWYAPAMNAEGSPSSAS